MNTVFLLVAMYYNNTIGTPTVYVETMAFKSAARCIRNQEANQKSLEKQFSHVEIRCTQKDVVPDGKSRN